MVGYCTEVQLNMSYDTFFINRNLDDDDEIIKKYECKVSNTIMIYEESMTHIPSQVGENASEAEEKCLLRIGVNRWSSKIIKYLCDNGSPDERHMYKRSKLTVAAI